MNFSEIVSAVTEITKRPDKVLDIRREVNSAISHFCTDVSFEEDRNELSVALDPTLYIQDVAMTNFPRYRKFWYIKLAGTKHYLTKLNERDLGKTDCDMKDKYYVSGTNLRLSASALAANIEVGYYLVPPRLSGVEEFWLIDKHPDMVIDRTAAKIFASLGDGDSARLHEGYAVAAFKAIKMDRGVLV